MMYLTQKSDLIYLFYSNLKFVKKNKSHILEIISYTYLDLNVFMAILANKIENNAYVQHQLVYSY